MAAIYNKELTQTDVTEIYTIENAGYELI